MLRSSPTIVHAPILFVSIVLLHGKMLRNSLDENWVAPTDVASDDGNDWTIAEVADGTDPPRGARPRFLHLHSHFTGSMCRYFRAFRG